MLTCKLPDRYPPIAVINDVSASSPVLVTSRSEPERSNEAAPSHRVFVGKVEIGAAWAAPSADARGYLSLKLDDPSFMAPIDANLFDDDDSQTAQLIWSRSRKANGE